MNNNQRIIAKLQKSSLRNNKSRTLMIALSIILTCVLLTSVITITLSLQESMEETLAHQVGSKAHGNFKHLTMEEANQLKEHELIKNYGLSTVVGLVTSEETKTRQIEIRTMDKQYMSDSYIDLVGDHPSNYNEIIVDTMLLDMLDLKHEINQSVELNIRTSRGEKKEIFNIVGYYQGNIFSQASYLLVSDQFKEENVLKDDYPDLMGTINLSINFSSKHHANGKMSKILQDNEMEYVKGGPNWAYQSSSQMQLADILSYIFLIIILMMSGYLIIYNIYLIAINKDINHYGLLKTIGATSTQIKKLVLEQAFKIYIVSLPIGLLMGYLFGQVLVPVILESLNTEVIVVSHNVWIFIIATFLTGVTVWISCRKPAKIAGTVSPIEAIRTADVTINRKPKRRKQSKVYQIAWHNVFRVRKKAFLVILSLSLSLVIFSAVLIRINSFSVNGFVSNMIGSEYLIADSGYFSLNHDGAAVSSDFVDEVESLGLEVHPFKMDEKTVYIDNELKSNLLSEIVPGDYIQTGYYDLQEGKITLEAFGVDAYLCDKLKPYVIEGTLPKVLKSDQLVIEDSFMTELESSKTPFNVGDIINVDGKNYDIVAKVSNVPLYMYNQFFSGYYLKGYIGHEQTNNIMSVMVENENSQLKDLMKKYPKLTLKSREDYVEKARGYIVMYKTVGYSLAALLALIGILNFVNITSTNIVVRKRELAMMQSIGMSSHQLRNMLMIEGGYILVFSLVITLILTLPLGLLMSGHLTFSFLIPLLYCTIILCCLIAVISYQGYKFLCKESIIERLQMVE